MKKVRFDVALSEVLLRKKFLSKADLRSTNNKTQLKMIFKLEIILLTKTNFVKWKASMLSLMT